VLLDDEGNQIGDAYSLSPSQDPRAVVAAWLRCSRANNTNRWRYVAKLSPLWSESDAFAVPAAKWGWATNGRNLPIALFDHFVCAQQE
jgi:hypothetical protein